MNRLWAIFLIVCFFSGCATVGQYPSKYDVLKGAEGGKAKISDLSTVTTTADGDIVAVVDISDTAQASTGSTRKVTLRNVLAGVDANILSTTIGSTTPTTIDNDGITTPSIDVTDPITARIIPLRGTAAEINAITLEAGEFATTTDTNELRVGDGTAGGQTVLAGNSAGSIIDDKRNYLFIGDEFIIQPSVGFTSSAIGAGSVSFGATGTILPGYITISEEGANTGGAYYHDLSGIFITDRNFTCEFRFETVVTNFFTSRMGIQDSFSTTEPMNGFWLDVNSSGTIRGKLKGNGGTATTASSYSIVSLGYVRARISYAHDEEYTYANLVFSLYSSSGALLWTDTLDIDDLTTVNPDLSTANFGIVAYSENGSGNNISFDYLHGLLDFSHLSAAVGGRP